MLFSKDLRRPETGHPRIAPALKVLPLVLFVLISACGSSSDTADTNPGGGNRPPSISGDPPTTSVVNRPYSFTPQAADPDGDTLTFNGQNIPSWTDFDTGTGTISGTPSMGNIGTYQNIVISVSDGQQSTSMSAYDVEVTQIGTGSATLTWSAPVRNSDGSVLTDLVGYIIFYGTSSRNYTQQVRIENPGITTYQIDGLSNGTYYFAAKAVNKAGVESNLSAEAVKDIQGT